MSEFRNDVRSRLSSLRLSPAREAEIVDELSQHLDDRYRELIAGGASPEEARRLALSEFRSGSMLAHYMAPLRQSNTPPPIVAGAPTGNILSDLWLDLRYATRVFFKQPAFAATAVLTLALGIGASTAIFGVVYGVLLKPLPFDDPAGLVSVKQVAPHGAGANHGPATYLTYRENQRVFEGIGAWDGTEVSITGGGNPERVQGLLVSSSTLPLLRVQSAIGRLFSEEDDIPGRPLHVILTHGYWQSRLGGIGDIIGKPLVVDGRPAEVIGVLPTSFKFLHLRPAVLLPLPLDVNAPRNISFGFQALARLTPGVGLTEANAEVSRLISLLPPVFARLELRPNVRPLSDDVIGDIGNILWILLAAVGVVLLIACGNVANLFLVRAEGRHQEFAMRAALGASRSRIARALLSESLALALAGGVVGVALASAAIGVLRTIAPAQLPRVDDITISTTVLLFTLAISVASGVLFGAVAVLRFGRPSVAALKEGGRGTSDAPGRHRTRHALVVGQVALALTLLIVSGLMIRTFIAMREVRPGFSQPEQVQTFRIAIPPGLISDPQQAARTHHGVADRLAQVPGVISVGMATHITMDGEDNGNILLMEDVTVPEGQVPPLRRYKSFAPGFVETMGNRMVAGRSITWTDVYEQRPVVVISEALAREYWREPGDAIGRRVRTFSGQWREIVGVSGDERDDGLNHPATAIVYLPMLNPEFRWRTMAYAVRSSRVGTAGFVRELEQAVWSVNPSLPLATIETLDEIQERSMAQTGFAMTMLAIAAAVALLIGVVGIYGMIAYVVAERIREIGIRMALGAQLGDVRGMFLRQGLVLTAIGITCGIAIALGVTRVLSTLLFGVGAADPATYAVVSAALAAATLVATYVSARHASRIDPIAAIRADG